MALEQRNKFRTLDWTDSKEKDYYSLKDKQETRPKGRLDGSGGLS
jgi:hypothetical protein